MDLGSDGLSDEVSLRAARGNGQPTKGPLELYRKVNSGLFHVRYMVPPMAQSAAMAFSLAALMEIEPGPSEGPSRIGRGCRRLPAAPKHARVLFESRWGHRVL